MLFCKTPLTLAGFSDFEIVDIQAKDIYSLAFQLGSKTKAVVKNTLARRLHKGDRKKALSEAGQDLEVIKHLSQKRRLVVGGVNYALEYFESLKGFADGAEISLAQCALLQKEIDAGCQTLIHKNANGEIAFLHTEEDGENDRMTKKYGYRMVRARFGKRNITFFSYPGLCLWGPAFGIDETNNFVQLVDELYIKEKHYGPLWANFIAFMFFDCANLENARTLSAKLKKISKIYPFHNGYSIHMLDGEKLSALSFELGGKRIEKIETDYKGFVQVNYPKNQGMRRISGYDKLTYLEMTRREKRLEKIFGMGIWKTDNAGQAIKTGLLTLAYPYGDLRKYKRVGKWVYYHTGLPSIWTAAHFAGFLAEKNTFYIGKLTPDPIEGMEYSNKIKDNYKYQEKKLWKMIRK